MSFSNLPLFAAALLSMSACNDRPVRVPDPASECEAGAFQELVGQANAPGILTPIAAPVRVIRPGQAVTLDYRPDRTNIELDTLGFITRIWCG
ncbi:MAG: hypothetical protein GY945_09375 [Rhodobacteraceae bacterium]|nr:hypothetical protein [Paracoccaceae bacterium]